ncbi:hypothetical protein H4Q26_017141 [Puccinia striiformis f. sp. tritici PST-130]|nr:hypothetical protein H4Q26_017141 [Puccinia striiformis f. sp. tritici PST-130]
MFARLSILVLLLTANLSSASPSSIGNAYQNMPATRSSSPLKRTTRTAFANNRANSTRVARSLPLLPLLGQILPVTANLKVDICLDLSVKVLGIATVNVFATAALAASITSQGISVDELAVVQASLASELAGVARVSTTSYACEQACTSDDSSPSCLYLDPVLRVTVNFAATDVDLPIALLAPLPNTTNDKAQLSATAPQDWMPVRSAPLTHRQV